MKSKTLFAVVVFFLTIPCISVHASVYRTKSLDIADAWQWANENALVVSLLAAAVLLLILFFELLRRRRISGTPPGNELPGPVGQAAIVPGSAGASNLPVTSDQGGKEHNVNSTGKSIVKAAWILGISAILCVLLLLVNHRYRSARYAPLDKLTYIDTWTGKCYYADGREIN